MRATQVKGLRVSRLAWDQWRRMIYRHRACNGFPFRVVGIHPDNPGVEILVPRGKVPESGPWVEASTAKVYRRGRYPLEINRVQLDGQVDCVTVHMRPHTLVYTRQGSGATRRVSKGHGRVADVSNLVLICAPKAELEAMRVDEIIDGRAVIEVPRTTGQPVPLVLGLPSD